MRNESAGRKAGRVGDGQSFAVVTLGQRREGSAVVWKIWRRPLDKEDVW